MNKILFLLPFLVLSAPLAFGENIITTVDGSGSPGCEVENGCYQPENITVSINEKIVFSNTDSVAHTFTSGHPDFGTDGLFDTGLLMAGNSFEFTPETSGQIDYFCMVHPWMVGSITVIGSSAEIIIPTTIPTDDLVIENEILRDENLNLKLENKQLKNKINSLELEIESLKDQIVSMTSEFVEMVTQLNEWFRSQLN